MNRRRIFIARKEAESDNTHSVFSFPLNFQSITRCEVASGGIITQPCVDRLAVISQINNRSVWRFLEIIFAR